MKTVLSYESEDLSLSSNLLLKNELRWASQAILSPRFLIF